MPPDYGAIASIRVSSSGDAIGGEPINSWRNRGGNASNYAVPAYEKLGFQRTEPTKNTNGVLYNPMVLVAAG